MSDAAKSPPTVVLLSGNLMADGQWRGLVTNTGATFVRIASADEFDDSGETPTLLIADLSAPGINPAFWERLSAELRSRTIAFGPHVHAAKLQTARDAGVAHVVSQGQMHAQGSRLIQAMLASVGP